MHVGGGEDVRDIHTDTHRHKHTHMYVHTHTHAGDLVVSVSFCYITKHPKT